jgi:hypothetical protein
MGLRFLRGSVERNFLKTKGCRDLEQARSGRGQSAGKPVLPSIQPRSPVVEGTTAVKRTAFTAVSAWPPRPELKENAAVGAPTRLHRWYADP